MKLEKLVKQMEKQEEYSQAQRTRLETRIARLEVAVKEGQQSQRYVIPKVASAVNFESYNACSTYRDTSPSEKHRTLYAITSSFKLSNDRTLSYSISDNFEAQEQLYINAACSCLLPARKIKHTFNCDRKRRRTKEHEYRELNYRNQAGIEKCDDAKSIVPSSKRTFPICKWILKPFIRDGNTEITEKHHCERYAQVGRESRNRHCGIKSLRTEKSSRHKSSHFVCSLQRYQSEISKNS